MVLNAASFSLGPSANHCVGGQLISYHPNTGGNISSGCKTGSLLVQFKTKLTLDLQLSLHLKWVCVLDIIKLVICPYEDISDINALVHTGLLWTQLQGPGWIHGLKHPLHLNSSQTAVKRAKADTQPRPLYWLGWSLRMKEQNGGQQLGQICLCFLFSVGVCVWQHNTRRVLPEHRISRAKWCHWSHFTVKVFSVLRKITGD